MKINKSGLSYTMQQAGADTEATLSHGETPLMQAARVHHIEIMKLLLDWGAEVNYGYDKQNALLNNALLGNSNPRRNWSDQIMCLKILIQHGLDVRTKSVQLTVKNLLVKLRGYGVTDPIYEHTTHVVSILYAAGAQISEDVCDRYISEEDIYDWYTSEDLYDLYRMAIPQFILDDQEDHTIRLSRLCRRRIRAYILSPTGGNQANLFNAVSWLPLPQKLKQYLLFDINI